MNPTDQHTPERRQAAGMLFYLQALAAAKRALWRWPLLITVVVTAASFLIPNTYRADVTILPPESDFQSTKAMGGLKGYFASELALPVMATPSDILAEVLKSRRVRDSVVAALDLAARWNITPTKAASDLQREMLVSVEKTGVIVVGVSNNDRWFSDTLVNTLVTAADRVNRSIVNTKARRTREFVEGRLADTESDLLAAGEALQKFQNEHRTVALDVEIAALIENAAKLRARITSDEIELSVLEGSLSPEHYRI
ncbi:MAG TPA: hypothetical protein VLB27_07020, partial [candidate division Zixibacteria bacterium]|nr:hypothetical protein [candidate division Zixibacteria bacterium]